MDTNSNLFSVVADTDGDTISIHVDEAALDYLISRLSRLRDGLQRGDCDHLHLMTKSWGSDDLTETMLADERSSGHVQVHHVKVLAWTDEWARKHSLR